MAKKKIKLSPGDKLSIFIASIALITAIFTTYIQFFHKTTDLRIGNIDFSTVSDTLSKQVDINILLLNAGTNPVALTEWYSFLSANESLTKGICYNNNINPQNTAIYTYGCGSNINEIIEPNIVEFIDLNLEISNSKLAEYVENNKEVESDESPYLNVGIHLSFVDSNGKKVSKEIIIGDLQFNENSTTATTYIKKPKELIIY
jgi:hypothetical protein